MKSNYFYSFGSLFIASLVCSNCSTIKEKQTNSQPNILLIYADDLGYADLSCQGSQDIRTPNIDAIASDGVRFTSGYVTAPQCGPSRAGLMTGLNQSCFGYLDNKNNQGLPPKSDVKTIAEYLQKSNYATGIIGKWHIGDEPEYSSAIIERSRPWNRGFDYVLMMNRGMSHYFPYRKDGENWMTSRDREPKLSEVKEGSKEIVLKDYPEDSYLTDIYSEEGVNFIRRHKDKPFFLYMAYNAPHTPLVAKEEDMKTNAHISDPNRKKFAAMMTALDRGVGMLRNEIKELGLEKNTLIFFISDNGGPTSKNTSKNDPFSGFKGDVLEGGIRIPFLACWPGEIPAGQVYEYPVTSLDVLPTAVSLAGGNLNDELEYIGVNLIPYLKGEKKEASHDILYWRWRDKTALRKGNMKLVEPFKDLPQSGMYNLERNVKEIPETKVENVSQKQQLKDLLEKWNLIYTNSINIDSISQ